MATIVPTSEADPVLSVVRFTSELAWVDGGPEVAEPQVARLCMEADECIIAGRWFHLVSLMLTSADLVASRVSEKDFECIFTVICNLVPRASSLEEEHDMAKLISLSVTRQPNDKPALRLKLLFNLYNLLENPYSRFFIYMRALDLASSGKVAESITPSFKKTDSFIQEWNIDKIEQRSFFLAISNILKDNRSMAKDYLAYLTKYLATFTVSDEDSFVEAKEEAVRSIIEFVKSPDVFQCDLLNMPAVRQLERDGKYALIYELLKVFLTKRLHAYLDFHAANSTLLKSYGLVHEDCITKMRLISLSDLSSSDSGEVPYSVIKDTLEIMDEEVEYWIVKAITLKVLDCKMDQMNQRVLVRRRTERILGQSQWQALLSQLGIWRANISNAVSTIQANKMPVESPITTQSLESR